MSARLHSEAKEEIHAAIRFYELNQPGLGAEFFYALEQAFSQIEQQPQLWKPDAQGRRQFLMKRFPFKLIYKYQEGSLFILAVAHMARRPGFWKSRR